MPTGSISPAGSGSASPSHERWPRCGSARASCCSTNQPRNSTCAAKPRSSNGSSPRRASAPPSSSRTASRRFVKPIGSVWSTAGALSNWEVTRNCSRRVGGTGRCSRCKRCASSTTSNSTKPANRWCMRHSPESLPPTIPSLWRTIKLGYRSEPRGLVLAFTMTVVMALPDALIALWLALLANGLDTGNHTRTMIAAIGLAVSATLTWFLKVVFDRLQRRVRDRLSVALEAHVATLQASVATIEHHERPEHLDRLMVLRNQAFALDHLFMSLFSMVAWIVRLVITLLLLGAVTPVLSVLP